MHIQAHGSPNSSKCQHICWEFTRWEVLAYRDHKEQPLVGIYTRFKKGTHYAIGTYVAAVHRSRYRNIGETQLARICQALALAHWRRSPKPTATPHIWWHAEQAGLKKQDHEVVEATATESGLRTQTDWTPLERLPRRPESQRIIETFGKHTPPRRSDLIRKLLLREDFSLLAAIMTEHDVHYQTFSPPNHPQSNHIHYALTRAAFMLQRTKPNYWRADCYMRIARRMVEQGGSIDEHLTEDSTGLWDFANMLDVTPREYIRWMLSVGANPRYIPHGQSCSAQGISRWKEYLAQLSADDKAGLDLPQPLAASVDLGSSSQTDSTQPACLQGFGTTAMRVGFACISEIDRQRQADYLSWSGFALREDRQAGIAAVFSAQHGSDALDELLGPNGKRCRIPRSRIETSSTPFASLTSKWTCREQGPPSPVQSSNHPSVMTTIDNFSLSSVLATVAPC